MSEERAASLTLDQVQRMVIQHENGLADHSRQLAIISDKLEKLRLWSMDVNNETRRINDLYGLVGAAEAKLTELGERHEKALDDIHRTSVVAQQADEKADLAEEAAESVGVSLDVLKKDVADMRRDYEGAARSITKDILAIHKRLDSMADDIRANTTVIATMQRQARNGRDGVEREIEFTPQNPAHISWEVVAKMIHNAMLREFNAKYVTLETSNGSTQTMPANEFARWVAAQAGVVPDSE